LLWVIIDDLLVIVTRQIFQTLSTEILLAIYFDESRSHFWRFGELSPIIVRNQNLKFLLCTNWKCSVHESSRRVAGISDPLHVFPNLLVPNKTFVHRSIQEPSVSPNIYTYFFCTCSWKFYADHMMLNDWLILVWSDCHQIMWAVFQLYLYYNDQYKFTLNKLFKWKGCNEMCLEVQINIP
jgi:hypothetical protein